MLLTATNTFAQDTVEISPWGYGLATNFGLNSGQGIPNTFSVSFQGILDSGGGLSLDFIALNGEKTTEEGSISKISEFGILGSLFLGFPIGDIFRPYLGGGLGICIYFMIKKGQSKGGELNAEFRKGGSNSFFIKDLK
jgi:hypothetical protein